MRIRQIGSALAAHYEKILAFAVLAGLLAALVQLTVRVGALSNIRKSMESEIDRFKPAYEHAESVDRTLFEEGMARIENPTVFSAWTNMLLVPKTRVWCWDCKWPIPIEIAKELEKCPFCGAFQPKSTVDVDDYDGDQDGMHDSWERTHKLDPTDKLDAGKDPDGDGFSNLDEFRGQTDPHNAEDYPPPENLLFLVEIKEDPFKLRFKSVNKDPQGNLTFQINLRGDIQTFFCKLGDEVEGFKVLKFEEKSEKRLQPGYSKPTDFDISELTLQRGDKLIVLIKDQRVMYSEYVAHLLFTLDGTRYEVRIDQIFEMKGKKYKVKAIDIKLKTVTIERILDNKVFEIGELNSAKQKSGQ